MKEMCDRLITVVDLLDKNEKRVSDLLGYANQTTLTKVRKGGTFVDAEKLHKLATIEIVDNVVANLHWIVAGQGLPFTNVVDSNKSDLAEAWSSAALSKIKEKQKNE